MNKDTILGFIRHGLTFAGGSLATKGLADSAEVESLVGALITIIGVVWSILEKRSRAAAKAQAAGRPAEDSFPGGPLLLLGALIPLAAILTGCVSSTSDQQDLSVVIAPDGSREERNITSRQTSRGFFDTKSTLRNFKATQTDKTQSTQIGALDSETSSTGAVQTLRIVVEGAKTLAPVP